MKRSRNNRILVLTDRFFPEEFIINDLVLELRNAGFMLEILTQQPSYPYGEVKRFPGFKNRLYSTSAWNGIPVHRIFTIQGYKTSRVRKILHYLHFAFFCSILLLYMGRRYSRILITQTGPLSQAIPAVISRKIYRNQLMIWTLDLWPDAVYAYGFRKKRWLSLFLDSLVRFVYGNTEIISVSSPGFVSRIKEYVPGRTIHFLAQWSELKDNPQEQRITLDSNLLHFTFAGNIGTSQNLERVLEGFKMASDVHTGIQLNIFGDGNNLEVLKIQVREQGIRQVVFWGRLAQSEMFSVLSQSHVLIISLRPDPLFERYIPLKFPAYLSVGKPIFAVIAGEVTRMVKEYNVGLTADPSNIQEIASVFSAFKNLDEKTFNRFSENTAILSEQHFNKGNIIREFIQHLSTDTNQKS